MCGIAGYTIKPESGIDRTLAAQALLAGIAERGADAVGYAHRGPDGRIAVHKQRSGASALLEEIDIAPSSNQVLVHVRDYTKGHPRIEANNHPVRHGAVVGIHNGIILNDEEILAEHGFERAAPEMTVDSEAIFALVEKSNGRAHVMEQLRGSMATAWLDERQPDAVFCARGVARPLWLGETEQSTFFASTKAALQLVERYLHLRLHKRELPDGAVLRLTDGRLESIERFEPDRRFEDTPLPAVRAPHEGARCLRRLDALVAA